MEQDIKISIDFHGVLTENPDFFKKFNALALQKGYEVYILSGGHTKDIEDFVTRFGISYSKIWSVVDYFDLKHQVKYYPDGSFYVSDKLWNKAKGEFCLKNNITCHIDDSWLYGQYFETPFCLYNGRGKNCLYTKNQKNLHIDFDQDPEKVLENIVSIKRT